MTMVILHAWQPVSFFWLQMCTLSLKSERNKRSKRDGDFFYLFTHPPLQRVELLRVYCSAYVFCGGVCGHVSIKTFFCVLYYGYKNIWWTLKLCVYPHVFLCETKCSKRSNSYYMVYHTTGNMKVYQVCRMHIMSTMFAGRKKNRAAEWNLFVRCCFLGFFLLCQHKKVESFTSAKTWLIDVIFLHGAALVERKKWTSCRIVNLCKFSLRTI